MKKNIITINGNTRCGKDTLAKLLKRYSSKYTDSVLILPFADYLKKVVGDILKISPAELDKRKEDLFDLYGCVSDVTFRDIIIDIAAALRGNFGKDVFMNEYKKEINNYDLIIIPDMRFQTEYDDLVKFMYNNNITVTFLKLDSNIDSCKVVSATDEAIQGEFDYIVENKQGEFHKLENQARRIIKNIYETK